MNENRLFATLNTELKSYLHPFDAAQLKKAYEFAAKAHAGQQRKSGEPYIVHPLSAAIILAKMRVDMPTIITCLLHDVPEDTEYTLENIEEHFGGQVSGLVAGITKLSAVYYKNNMQDRQIDTLRRMFLVMAKDIRVVLVKLADRLHNMRTLDYVNPEKSYRIAKETMEIFSPLANLLGVWELRQEMDDLCFKYVYAQEYENIKKAVSANRKQHKNHMPKLKETVIRLLVKEKLKAKVESRWKHLFSIYKKMRRTRTTSPALYDIPVIRIIVDDVSECYKTLGLIHSKWKPQPNHFKDYIAVAKPNGYRSLHTTVFGPHGILVEFQIRTKEMDLEAKYGVASGFIYDLRGGSANIDSFLENTPWIKKVLKLQNKKNVKFIEDLKMNVLSDRVFVFTPEGSAVDIPQGSSTLDFAYTVSPALGNRYDFAYVNKEKKPISYELQTGDIVEIVTNKNSRPKREWLYFVITDEAKEAITKTFKKLTKKERVEIGESILDDLFALVKKGGFKNRSKKEKARIAKFFGYDDKEIFLRDIGSGEKSEKELTDKLLRERGAFVLSEEFLLHRFFTFLLGSQERLETIRTRLKLVLKDRVGLLSDIFDVLAFHEINIKKLTARDRFFSRGAAVDYIDLEVRDLSQLHRAIRSLESIEGVEKVFQSRAMQYIVFYGTIAVGVLIWVAHPVVISYLAQTGVTDIVSARVIFALTTVFLLWFMFYFRKFGKPYAPLIAGRKRFAVFFNTTILLVLGTLLFEVLSLHLISLFVFLPIMLALLLFGFWWSEG